MRVYRLSRGLTVIAVGALTWSAVLVAGADTASALSYDNMYPTGNTSWGCLDGSPSIAVDFCQTDNATMTVFMEGSVNSTTKSIVKSALTSEFNPTDLNVSVQSSGVYSGGSETDVVYQQSNSGFSGTAIGMTWCDDAVSGVSCDQQYVRFRYSSIDLETACHETGHAVGLTHGDDAFPAQPRNSTALGCMETPDTGEHYHLGSNNVVQINATY
jgi:hypothetical protein